MADLLGTRRSPVLLLEAANLVSGAGNSMVLILLPWLVLTSGGSALTAGAVGAISALPGIVAAPVVGVLVDRFGRRRISVISDVCSAASVALFPILADRGELSVPMITALAVLGAVFDPAGYTGRKALIPDVAHAARMPVTRLNGIHESVFAAGFAAGPAVAAVLIGRIGALSAMWVAAAMFLLAAVLVSAIRVQEAGLAARKNNQDAVAEGAEASATSGWWHEAMLGMRILVQDRVLLVLTIVVAIVTIIYMPTEGVLLPVHFESLGDPRSLGIVLSAMSAGVILGSALFGWLAARFSYYRIITGALILCTAAMFPMALLPATPLLAAAGFALGFGWGPMEPLFTSLVQQRVPPDAQGRVLGAQMSVYYAAPPVGLLLGGAAVQAFGVRATYLAIAAGIGLVSVVAAWLPSVRALQTPTVHVGMTPDPNEVPDGTG